MSILFLPISVADSSSDISGGRESEREGEKGKRGGERSEEERRRGEGLSE